MEWNVGSFLPPKLCSEKRGHILVQTLQRISGAEAYSEVLSEHRRVVGCDCPTGGWLSTVALGQRPRPPRKPVGKAESQPCPDLLDQNLGSGSQLGTLLLARLGTAAEVTRLTGSVHVIWLRLHALPGLGPPLQA